MFIDVAVEIKTFHICSQYTYTPGVLGAPKAFCTASGQIIEVLEAETHRELGV